MAGFCRDSHNFHDTIMCSVMLLLTFARANTTWEDEDLCKVFLYSNNNSNINIHLLYTRTSKCWILSCPLFAIIDILIY